MAGQPFPKQAQVGRGPKRQRRKVARPLEWAAIRAVKFGPCRVRALGGCSGRIELHHLLPKAHGGDDVSSNIASVCSGHHGNVTSPAVKAELARNLTDAEYAYLVEKLGEGGIEWLFGVFQVSPRPGDASGDVVPFEAYAPPASGAGKQAPGVFACIVDESAGLAS